MGGIEAQVRQLAQHQSRTDEVAVFTTTPAHVGDRGRSLERDGDVTVFRLAARMPLGLPIHLRAPHHLTDVLERFQPAVVHLHMGGLAPSTQLSMLAVGGYPCVLTIHSMWDEAATLGYAALARITGFRRWAPTLTTVAKYPAEKIGRATGLPVRVLGCGVYTAEWQVEPEDHDGVHVVCATRFTHRKRTLELLRILREAHERAPQIRATIAGEGPLLGQARERTKEWGWLSLPGRLSADELRSLYARADVFALPSILEAGSVAVLEAQCAGLAVVVRAETGVADRILHGINGYVVASDSGMADALTGLTTLPGELAAMKRYAHENQPPYDWSDVATRAQEAYAEARAR